MLVNVRHSHAGVGGVHKLSMPELLNHSSESVASYPAVRSAHNICENGPQKTNGPEGLMKATGAGNTTIRLVAVTVIVQPYGLAIVAVIVNVVMLPDKNV